MIRLKQGRVLLAAAILLGGALSFFAIRSSRKPALRLSDGTILRLERIDYGRRQPSQLDAWREGLQSVIDHLPAWLSRNLPNLRWTGAWSGGELPAPGEDALNISLTRQDARSAQYLDTGLYWADILDEHGCHFIAARAGGMTHRQNSPVPRYEVGWFAFQAFPRRQKQFRLCLYDRQQKFVGELLVPNPTPARAAAWKVEPLPITRRAGDLAFTLESLLLNGSRTNPDQLEPPPLIAPRFSVSENGKPTKEWEAVQTEMIDSTGNKPSRWPFNSPFLCQFEPAWKLRVKFCGKEISGVASNACWTVPHLKLPSPGSFAALSVTQQVQGLTLRLIGLAGAGHTSYSNEVPVRAYPLSGLEKEEYSETSMAAGSGGRMDTRQDIQMPVPHVALRVSGLPEDQRISVQARDEQGRSFFVKVWDWDFPSGGFKERNGLYLPFKRGSHYFLGLDLPVEVTELDLTVCVHRARTVEFVVQPPGRAP